MRNILCLAATVLLSCAALAASKPHVIAFGKLVPVKWYEGTDADHALTLGVRALYVDARLKEYTIGAPHEVTDRLFVVRRAFRLNDSLPGESAQRWTWQRGGWLLVDRVTGRVSQISLPEFDPFYSTPSWYRDYVAYCGVSDDGRKLYAVVAQLGRRKPILKQPLGNPRGEDEPDSECPAPHWERQPSRVTFMRGEAPKLTYAVRGHAVDIVNDADDQDDEGSE